MNQSVLPLSTLPPIPSHTKWKWAEHTHWGRVFVSWRLYVRNPVPLPGFIPAAAPVKARRLLRTLYAAELEKLGNPGRLTRTFMVVCWAVITAGTCIINFRRHRSEIRCEMPSVDDLGHFQKLVVCAFRHNIAPGEFYQFKLYLDQSYRQRRYYLLRWQVTTLLGLALPANDFHRLNDKYQLWRNFTTAGIPTVPVLALVEGGNWIGGDWAEIAAQGNDLVIKPVRLSCGNGIEFLDFAGADRWHFDGRTLTGAEARERITRLSREHPFLIQPRLENIPLLARYGTRGLATIRIVTVKTRAMSAPTCLIAVLRIPNTTSRLANFHKQSLACPIDLDTGRLGPAAGSSPAAHDLAVHPTTGAPLAGEILPHWADCKACCLQAHQLAPTLNSVGWDVILTPAGPLVLEANLHWGARVLQIATQVPLLLTPFVDYYEGPAESSKVGNPK